MRRIASVALSFLMALSLWLMTGSTANASSNSPPGGMTLAQVSSYSGESVFTNFAAGGSGQQSAIFFNDGTQAWAPGVVGLLICLPDKVTCNVVNPLSLASRWFSSTVYATVSAISSQNGFFIYNFMTTPAGSAVHQTDTFNGDVGIATNAESAKSQFVGQYQINTAPAMTGSTISPTSASLPIGDTLTMTGVSPGTTITSAGYWTPTAFSTIGQSPPLQSMKSTATMTGTYTFEDKFASTANNTATMNDSTTYAVTDASNTLTSNSMAPPALLAQAAFGSTSVTDTSTQVTDVNSNMTSAITTTNGTATSPPLGSYSNLR